MVYLYSVLCCLFLFPYLGWRGGQALGARARRLYWGLLATIFVLFFLCLATHRLFQADWMSAVMNGMVYIFFSTLYVAAAVFLINGLRRLDARYWGCYGRLGCEGRGGSSRASSQRSSCSSSASWSSGITMSATRR